MKRKSRDKKMFGYRRKVMDELPDRNLSPGDNVYRAAGVFGEITRAWLAGYRAAKRERVAK